MRTTTELASYFDISSARKLNEILQELNIQRKDNFGRWILINKEHRKYEKYKEIMRNGKTMHIRVFTDEGKLFIENLLIENGYYKKLDGNRGETYERYKTSYKRYKYKEHN